MDSANYNFALKIGSGAYKTDGAENDMGAILGNILISASNVSINGFYIDGQDAYFSGIYKTGSSDYSGTSISFCKIENFQGSGFDDYSGADTLSTIISDVFLSNGTGIVNKDGTNKYTYDVIAKNTAYGIWTDTGYLDVNHCTFSQNGAYGIKMPFNSFACVRNSIFNANGAYEIYPVNPVLMTNCDINGLLPSTVTATEADGNISDNPLFVDETDGEEDYQLKNYARGYIFNSLCIGKADDGYDMGAYIETQTVNGESWRTYQIEHDPTNMNRGVDNMTPTASQNNFGSLYHRARNSKMAFPMIWQQTQASNRTQMRKMWYFSTLIPTLINGLKKEETVFRLWLLPETHLESGVSVTVDTVTDIATIADSGKSYVENEFRGFYLGLIFASFSSSVDKASAIVTASGVTWTTNQWAGYYYKHEQMTFLILGNNADQLQLSDPLGQLTSQSETGTVEGYFRIKNSDGKTFTLDDKQDYLLSNPVGWYIAFVRCVVQSDSFTYSQPNFVIDNYTAMSGYSILFQEE
jgi:hypothetical protein